MRWKLSALVLISHNYCYLCILSFFLLLISQMLFNVITDIFMFFLHPVFLSSYQGIAVKEPCAQPIFPE